MFCSYCGTEIQDDAAFCSKCGKPVKSQRAPEVQPGQMDYNITISCTSGHKKAYTEVEAAGQTVKVFSGQSANLLLPAGNQKIHFFTRRYGLTWVKSKDRYERDLFVEPGKSYHIAVMIGQATNRIDITG